MQILKTSLNHQGRWEKLPKLTKMHQGTKATSFNIIRENSSSG